MAARLVELETPGEALRSCHEGIVADLYTFLHHGR